jgi:hypothetical protein
MGEKLNKFTRIKRGLTWRCEKSRKRMKLMRTKGKRTGKRKTFDF